MLMVALMGVAGAWAQNNVIRYTATSKIADTYWQNVSGSTTRIGTHTFDPASKLGVVTYNNDITAIRNDAFDGLPLISIDLPSGVSSIGGRAFLTAIR